MLNFLNKFFGYRWSLYISNDKKELFYVMHFDDVIALIGYVEMYFLQWGNPKEPWRIYLNFNKTHQNLLLTKEYFINGTLTETLLEKIKKIDPEFSNVTFKPHQFPYVKDVVNNRRIKILSSISDPKKILESMKNSNKEEYLSSVLQKIFR